MGSLSSICVLLTLYFATVSGQYCPAYWQGYYQGNAASNYCYRFATVNTMSWQDARDFCQIHGGDLLQLDSVADKNWLVNHVKSIESHNKFNATWWTGLNNREFPTVWEWADGTKLAQGVINWNRGAPGSANGQQKCGVLTQGKFDLKDCGSINRFICQRSRATPMLCDADRGWQTLNGQCYKMYGNKKNWNDAVSQCNHDGGAIVTIDNQNDEVAVRDFAVSLKTPLWIGVRSQQTGNSYVWVYPNSTQIAATTYFHSPPRIGGNARNSSCVMVNNNVGDLSAWTVSRCNAQRGFVCRKPEGVCFPGWIGHRQFCYQFNVHFIKSFNGATTYCRQQGAELLRLDRATAQAFIQSYLQEMSDSGVSRFWIGLSDNNKNGGPFLWRNNRNSTYQHWQGNKQPANSRGHQDCVYISTRDASGSWRSTTNCNAAYQYVCMIPMGRTVKAIPRTPRPHFGCPTNWKQYNGMCYHVNQTGSDWLTARDVCKQSYNGADLAVISDSHIQGYVTSHLNLQKDVRYWIGLSDRTVQNYYTWLDATLNTTYTNWKPREPNDYHGVEKCVSILNSQWMDNACNQKYKYICGKPADSINISPPPTTPATDWTVKCGTGWESNPVTDNCYMFVDQPLSWLDALLTCNHNHGTLVAIENSQEQNYIAARLQSMNSIAVWIGANDRGHELIWKWPGGKPFAYFNWAAGQPNTAHGGGTDCVAMFTQNAQWDDVNCNNRNGYICEKKGRVPRTHPVSVSTTPKVPAGMALGCRPGWKPFQNSCYQFVRTRITGDDAKTRCARSGGQLASIHSTAEQNFIVANLPKGKKYDAFVIGMDDHLQEMMFTWQDGSPVTYTKWNAGEPNNYLNREEDCVDIWLSNGLWNDETCYNPLAGYICKAPKQVVSATQNPYQQGCPLYSNGYGSYCYRTVAAKKSWSDANAYCVSQYKGTLAAINDRFLQSFLSTYLAYRASGHWWIGLSDTASPGTYVWSSNAPVSFTYWTSTHTGNEQSTCVAMRAEQPIGLWENSDCTSEFGFICQYPRSGYTPPPTTPTLYPSNIPCPSGWTEFNKQCYYVFGDKKLTWMESEAFCNSIGGALPSIHSKAQDNFLSGTLLTSWKNKGLWIGLNDRDTETGFVWSDSSAVDFTNWNHGEPNDYQGNEDCTQYTTWNNLWNDYNCYSSGIFICAIPKGVTLPVSTVLPNSLHSDLCGSDPSWYYNQDTDNCYYASPATGENSTMSWYDAGDFCKGVGANLASIHGQQENLVLESIATKIGMGSFWVGLNELDLNGYSWSDGTPTDYVNWNPNEPNDYFGAERCVEIYGHGQAMWNDLVCSAKLRFVCKKPAHGKAPVVVPPAYPPGGCSNGFTKVPGGRNKCFKIGGTTNAGRLNWTAARDACRSFGKNYDIASIEDMFEQEFATQMLAGQYGNVWIGLTDIGSAAFNYKHKFFWQDNAPVEFLNWDRGEPTSGRSNQKERGKIENCVLMRLYHNHQGKWADVACNTPRSYICQTRQDPNVPAGSPANTCQVPGYQSYNSRCYKVSSDVKSWNDAATSCQKDGATLATINNIYENAFIYTLANNKMPYWIGLSDSKVHGLYGWQDGWPVKFTKWGYKEPSYGTYGGCVFSNRNARWNDSDCSRQLHYACKISQGPPPTTAVPTGSCADPTWIPDGDLCYYVNVNDRRSWPEANYQCQKRNMDLVSIHSQQEMDFVYNLVTQAKVIDPKFRPNIWTGMTKGPDGAFKWSDNSAVNFLYWAPGEPSGTGLHNELEECIQFNRMTKTWNDLSCFAKGGYVCKAMKGTPQVHSASNIYPGGSGAALQSQSSASSNGGGLSNGGIAGVIIAALVVLGVVVIAFMYLKRTGKLPTVPFAKFDNDDDTKGFDNVSYSRDNDIPVSSDA